MQKALKQADKKVLSLVEKYVTRPLWEKLGINNFMLAQVLCILTGLGLAVHYLFFSDEPGSFVSAFMHLGIWGYVAKKHVPKFSCDAYAAIKEGRPSPMKIIPLMIYLRLLALSGTTIAFLCYLDNSVSGIVMVEIIAIPFYFFLVGCEPPPLPASNEAEASTG